MSLIKHNSERRPPPGQEHEDYLKTIEEFHAWCEQRKLPFRPAHNQVLRHFMDRIPGQPGIATAPIVALSRTSRPARTPISRKPRQHGPRPKMIARIELGKSLLASTDLTITAIAAKTGFFAVGPFCGTFKEITGQTPGQYRAAHRRSA